MVVIPWVITKLLPSRQIVHSTQQVVSLAHANTIAIDNFRFAMAIHTSQYATYYFRSFFAVKGVPETPETLPPYTLEKPCYSMHIVLVEITW